MGDALERSVRVFVSYTRRDPDQRSLRFGRQLVRFLLEHGVDVMFDELSFRHAEGLAEQIVHSIYLADRFILIASPAAFDSNYVLAELKLARDRAVQLHPEPFIHVVSLADDRSLDYLPPDLRASLCHVAADTQPDRLLYEVFLALHGCELGELIAMQLQRYPGARWLHLERYQTLNVLEYDGTTRVTAIRAVCNVSQQPAEWSDYVNVYATGLTEEREIEVLARTEAGSALHVEKLREPYRGKPADRARIHFPHKTGPGDVCVYRTEYVWPRAFDLQTGGSFTIDAQEKAYAYLRVDLVLPRYGIATPPMVRVTKADGATQDAPIKQIGWNVFSSRLVGTAPGHHYEYRFGMKREREPGH